MKLLITIISALLLILQTPIQAEEELNYDHSDNINFEDLSLKFEVAINTGGGLSEAQTLLDTYKKTDDLDKKEKILKTLKIANKLGNSYLHIAAEFGNSDIIEDTINTFKDDRPDFLNEILIMQNKEKYNLFHMAAQFRPNVIKTTISALKDDHTELLEKLMISVDNSGHTFLHNTLWGMSDRVHFTIEALKDKHINLLKKVLLSVDDSGHTFLHSASRDIFDHPKVLQKTIDPLKDKHSDLLKELLLSTDNTGGTFLHSAAESHSGDLPDIIKISCNMFKDNHSQFLKSLLMSVDNSGHTFLHRSAIYNDTSYIDFVHQNLKQNLDAQFIDDTQLFSLKNRAYYRILNSIENSKSFLYDSMMFVFIDVPIKFMVFIIDLW
ncbi:MAG: hypothetical protein ACON5A_05700 [Candidatus Comchoanobacterales bacterium]